MRLLVSISILLSLNLLLELGSPVKCADTNLRKSGKVDCSSRCYVPSHDDIVFGETQLKQLLKDRPIMQSFINQQDKLWHSVVYKFAGIETGHRVRWNNESIDKPSQYTGDHNFSAGADDDCYIRLSKLDANGNSISGEELWSTLFFEFENLKNSDSFFNLYKQACAGKLTKEQWITRNTKLEYSALRRTYTFYEKDWIPLMKKKNISTNPVLWNSPIEPTYEAWIKTYDTTSSGNYNYWSMYFDTEIIPYLKKKSSR